MLCCEVCGEGVSLLLVFRYVFLFCFCVVVCVCFVCGMCVDVGVYFDV